MTNVNRNIAEATKAALILFQATPQVVFHPDAPVFSTSVLTNSMRCPALPASAGAVQVAHALTNTADSNTATSHNFTQTKDRKSVV